MVRKMISTWGMIVILLASIVGTAAAQIGTETDTPPVATPTTLPAGPVVYSHPIVQILSAYFGRKGVSSDPLVTATPVVTVTVDPNATLTPEPTEVVVVPGPEEIAAQIAQYHADGMGFGVLVKLYAMAEESAEKCATELTPAAAAADGSVELPAACTVVTVEELVAAVHGGAGMGTLFKEYGKPALLGVGHVKKELKHLAQEEPETMGTPEPGTEMLLSDDKGKGNGSKQDKDKPNKDKSNKKDK